MLRVTAVWTGGPMGTGVNIFHFDGAAPDEEALTDLLEGVRALYDPMLSAIPPTYTIAVSNEIEVRAEDTGGLIATVTPPGVAAQPGSSGSPTHAAGVGARVRWQTNGIRNGRRVVGTTFMVPLVSQAFEANGTLGSGTIGNLVTGGNALIGAANALSLPLAVWSRPTSVGAADGALHLVEACAAPDQAAWLTSRRQ